MLQLLLDVSGPVQVVLLSTGTIICLENRGFAALRGIECILSGESGAVRCPHVKTADAGYGAVSVMCSHDNHVLVVVLCIVSWCCQLFMQAVQHNPLTSLLPPAPTHPYSVVCLCCGTLQRITQVDAEQLHWHPRQFAPQL